MINGVITEAVIWPNVNKNMSSLPRNPSREDMDATDFLPSRDEESQINILFRGLIKVWLVIFDLFVCRSSVLNSFISMIVDAENHFGSSICQRASSTRNIPSCSWLPRWFTPT